MKKSSGKSQLILLAVCVAVAVFSGVKLISYFGDLAKERVAAEKLKTVYYAAETPTPEILQDAAVTPVMTELPVPTDTPEPVRITQNPTQYELPTPNNRLKAMPYPGQGANLLVQDSFRRLKEMNPDIVGWVKIEDVCDDAVVQKDNSKYLNHDYTGNENVNGALFLDMAIGLKTRPYTYLVYGHNMKTGAMFGRLLKYREASWYRNHAFVTFNTQYEDGEYVIFSAAKIQVVGGDGFVDLYGFLTDDAQERTEQIKRLKDLSFFSTGVDVQPEDQLLMLVTCDGEEDERFAVTARRLRDGESRENMASQVFISEQRR